jgi:hypothetical protein
MVLPLCAWEQMLVVLDDRRDLWVYDTARTNDHTMS